MQFGRELRRLREASRVSRDQVATELDCDLSKVSRIETGRQGISVGEVRLLLGLFGVDDEAERDRILDMAREARKRQEPRPVPQYLRAYVSLEAEALEIKAFQIDLVPSLLQTESYIRAIAHGHDPTQSRGEVDQLVAIRRERQARLLGDDPPALWVVLHEAAIRTIVGGPGVMREQLARVIELANLPHVTVQVIPFRVGAHASMGTAFTIVRVPDGGEAAGNQIVYLEDMWSADYLEKPRQVSAYSVLFDRLCTSALTGPGTVTAIEGVIRELS
jgi:transcriptional regulator with XRE-family HTH domain